MLSTSSCLVKWPICVYDGSCSDQIVKSPPYHAATGPPGSWLDIRIVGFIFFTHVGACRGRMCQHKMGQNRLSKNGAPGHLTSKSHRTKHHQNNHVRSHRAPCSGTPRKTNDSSMDSSLPIDSATNKFVLAVISFYGHNAI